MENFVMNEELPLGNVNDLKRLNDVLEELKTTRMALLKLLRDYYVDIRDRQIKNISHYRNKRRARRRYVSISTEYLDRIKNLNSIFTQFKILGPGVIEYGSRKIGNYRICIVGVKDCFRNAIWIHTNLIQELIFGIWPVHNDISKEFEHYSELLEEYKYLSYKFCK